MLDMGTLLIAMSRQYVCLFICDDGVDQAKIRVRRALTYHFVVADADMKKLFARQKSMTCTNSQLMLKFGCYNTAKFRSFMLLLTSCAIRVRFLVGSKACW